MSKSVLLIDTIHPVFISQLSSAGFLITDGHEWSREKIISKIHSFSGIAIRSRIKLDKHILEKATALKFIARAGAGMENIDVSFAVSKNIACYNAPEGNRDAVGEHAIAMLLSLFNNILKADAEVRNGIWLREQNRGIELNGKTVGIIGFGNMGSAFAEKLKGFGVNILVYDKYISLDKKKYDFVEQVSLSEVFAKTDVLSLHIPLTDETRWMINDAFIASFKKNIYIINTSRGQCLGTDDLVKHLKTGKVLGACLDVLEYETTSFEKIEKEKLPYAFQFLCKSKNVILSPHIAGWTHESNEKIAITLANKIINPGKK